MYGVNSPSPRLGTAEAAAGAARRAYDAARTRRNQRAAQAWLDGMTIYQIGAELGVSASRAARIVRAQLGGPLSRTRRTALNEERKTA